MNDLHPGEIRLRGLALSEGYAVARVCMFNEHRHSNLPMYRVAGSGVDHEEQRIRRSIEIAGERLRSSHFSETSIAASCGFSGMGELEKYFKKFCRTTPYKFREEYQVT